MDTVRTNGGGSPPGFISCALEGEGDGEIVLLARNRPRNSPLFTKAAPTAVSPVWSAATGRRPRHPGPATACLCDDGTRRWPCRFAQMALAAMSRPPAGLESPSQPASWSPMILPIQGSEGLGPVLNWLVPLLSEKARTLKCHSPRQSPHGYAPTTHWTATAASAR